ADPAARCCCPVAAAVRQPQSSWLAPRPAWLLVSDAGGQGGRDLPRGELLGTSQGGAIGIPLSKLNLCSMPEPRIAPLTDPTPEVKELLDKTKIREGPVLNIFATMAHHPRLLKRLNVLGGLFLGRGLLPARERELVILRTAWRTGCVYEFGQHTLLGRREG